MGYSGTLDQLWADLRLLAVPPRNLTERIRRGFEIYPCDLLFLHRDAERMPHAERKEELLAAFQRAFAAGRPPAVCVVPVKMMEAWLLFDEDALRRAAGRPSDRRRLQLPPCRQLEDLADPKGTLHHLLLEASGTTGRRRKKFATEERVHRLADLIENYSPLRVLPAFSELERDLHAVLLENRWISA